MFRGTAQRIPSRPPTTCECCQGTAAGAGARCAGFWRCADTLIYQAGAQSVGVSHQDASVLSGSVNAAAFANRHAGSPTAPKHTRMDTMLTPCVCTLLCVACRVMAEVEDSVQFADESPKPEKGQLLENVFADPRGFGIAADGRYRYELPGFTSGTAQVS